MTLYGQLIGADDVADVVKAHLDTWSAAYIAEVARQAGLDAAALPPFRLFEIRADDILEVYATLPACHVRVVEDKPVRQRQGHLTLEHVVAVRIAAGATSEETTSRLVARYANAVRACLLQHPSLGGAAETVRLIGSTYTTPQSSKALWAGEATVRVAVTVADVVDIDAGPTTPPVDPLAPAELPPPITSVQITLEHQEM